MAIRKIPSTTVPSGNRPKRPTVKLTDVIHERLGGPPPTDWKVGQPGKVVPPVKTDNP